MKSSIVELDEEDPFIDREDEAFVENLDKDKNSFIEDPDTDDDDSEFVEY